MTAEARWTAAPLPVCRDAAIRWLLTEEPFMRFASVAEIKDGLSEYLARARKRTSPSS